LMALTLGAQPANTITNESRTRHGERRECLVIGFMTPNTGLQFFPLTNYFELRDSSQTMLDQPTSLTAEPDKPYSD
jgi:hypothetical protein